MSNPTAGANLDMKFEIVVVPVAGVDRARESYARLGWRLDADFESGPAYRVVQFTPPGSGCSVIFGVNVSAAQPGSAQGLYLVVSDIALARAELLSRGIEVGDVFHPGDETAGPDEPYVFGRLRLAGGPPDGESYKSFASLEDPDGQRVAVSRDHVAAAGTGSGRHHVRVGERTRAGATTRSRGAWRRCGTGGGTDPNWLDWCAEYMVRE